MFCAAAAHAQIAPPKTSKHASFKPADYERIAVIVKAVQAQNQMRYGHFGNGNDTQGNLERLVEQAFVRELVAHGYTLVSRMDLDAAAKEQGPTLRV
jgi:hypothetical protein